MKCKEPQERFSAYLDKELAPGELLDLEQHLAECAECAQELAVWREAVSALSEVLACDAVPRKSLEEVVAECTAGTDTPTTRWSGFVGWLTSPRHALASTVAGSVAITFLLLILVWTVGNGVGAVRSEQPSVPTLFGHYGNMMGLDNVPIERSFNNGTKENRRFDRGRIDTDIAANPRCT